MQCKRCNGIIPEGYMYCPTCGEEVIIVSDFEIKLDDNIDTRSIAKTVELPDLTNANGVDIAKTQEIQLNKPNSQTKDNSPKAKSDKDKNKKSINKKLVILLSVIAMVLVVVAIVIAILISRYNNHSYQIEKAKVLIENGDYEKSIKTLKHANSLEDSIEGVSLLADSYISIHNYDAAIAVLYDAINRHPDEIALYDSIVSCYEAQGNNKGIHDLIVNSNDSNLALRFNSYVSISPTFSLEEGTYVEPDPIKLQGIGDGEIYYTTDGKTPTTDSLLYIGPIPLEYGATTIKAIYVNEKGIISDPVQRTYIVEMNVPDTPTLMVASGNKTIPELIGVNYDESLTVYYTVNGNEPDENSKQYTAPFLMPIGKNTYKFIAFNSEGKSSDIVEGTYDLTLKGTIDTQVAEYAISYQLMSKGENVVANTYVTNYGYKDDNHIYYIIEEMTGTTKTGRMFAVDINTGELFNFTKNKDETYSTSLM